MSLAVHMKRLCGKNFVVNFLLTFIKLYNCYSSYEEENFRQYLKTNEKCRLIKLMSMDTVILE